MKKKIIVANWKLNGSIALLNDVLKPIANFVNSHEIYSKLIIALPFVYLYPAYNIVMDTKVIIGAQNVDIHPYGAFTGEISANMLNDIHIKFVIIGHSERRLYHKENNQLIAEKFKIVKNSGLIPILCIGETEKDHSLFMAKKICREQIDEIIHLLGEKAFNNTIIAYEPVWAIGSGKTPSSNFIKEVCDFIKVYILNKQNINENSFFIQYGGSVNEKNIQEICNISSIDGVLVGSASLLLDCFLKILTIVSKEYQKSFLNC
ncbi:MAG: triose-phosphate isomerase [Buchnera aphidicola (Nurudea yanoniella)]